MFIRQLTTLRTFNTIASSFNLLESSLEASQCLKRWLQISSKLEATKTTSVPSTVALVKRPPVVTIMGHVDHGKTTLLDHLRNSHIVKQEFGGITQHIGAFVVPFERPNAKQTELLTFLDTPGHAAFASMRQRGADITDIIVLVVACEDGVLEQTVESIKYAKASQVPIIVAVNKIDKYPDKKELMKNIEVLKSQLVGYDVKTEEDGGDVQLVKISALKGIGIEDLKEAILALAETLELNTRIDCNVSGRVIESSIDAHRGKLCTILVQKGELRKGHYLVAGHNWAKVRSLFDERGQLKQACGPGFPIQVSGWRESEVPSAGDAIVQVGSEADAKAKVNQLKEEKNRKRALMDAKLAAIKAEENYKFYKEKLIERRESGYLYSSMRRFLRESKRPKEFDRSAEEEANKKVNLVLKCDVDGSLEALLELIDTYDQDNRQPVKLDVMHYGVGAISQNDLALASLFPNSYIYGFNVKLAEKNLILDAKRIGVELKLFNVIYHLIDDLKLRLGEKVPEVEQELEVGRANVIQDFVVRETGRKKIKVAGCRCSRGLLRRDLLYKLIRNNEILAEGLQVRTLKHLKDDVKEILKEQEFGISFMENEDIEFRPGDQLFGYEKHKVKPKLKWDLKGFH